VQAVRGVTLRVAEGETVGIVGESGSGKSVLMLSLLGLLPDNAQVRAQAMRFADGDLGAMSGREKRRLLGSRIGMVFQDPMTSLNPLFTVEQQLTEPLRIHQGLRGAKARARALDLLRMVDMPSPENRLKQYPHEFSGGMRQRVMIAIAIACGPRLIIADEPTTALDVTIQAQILDLLRNLQKELGTSTILITHDLGVISSMCRRVVVMYGGIVAEEGSLDEIFYSPRHPYTWGLLRSIPEAETEHRLPLVPIPGSPPDMLAPPQGCPFAPRCRHAMPVCLRCAAPETELSPTHKVRCHLTHPAAPQVRWEKEGL
jgi:oligopeptide transport system ATP-binding protein